MQEPQRIATNPGWRKSPPLADRHHVAPIVYPLWLVEHELFDIGLSLSRGRSQLVQLSTRLHCQQQSLEDFLGLVVDSVVVDLSRPVRFESGTQEGPLISKDGVKCPFGREASCPALSVQVQSHPDH